MMCALLSLLKKVSFLFVKSHTTDMNGHINETAPPLVSIGEVKLVQVQIVVWFVRTCEVWILFVLYFAVLLAIICFYTLTASPSTSVCGWLSS